MRKGLKLTLMTVAIALVSVQAMAMAPTIGDIPSPIVGSAEPVTGGSKFVYIDAFDIQPLASDDSTAQANLMWSFSGSSLHYTINGVAPLNLSTADPTSPTTAQIINRTVAGGEWNMDGKKNTITIRNQTLSPLGPNTNVDPPGTGIIASETQLVTFFCSDGNAYSSKTAYFYTDDGGNDRLSAAGWKSEKSDPMVASTRSWFMDTAPGQVFGSVTTHTYSGANGLCLELPLAGDNWGSLITAYGYVPLTANKIYRIKLTMNSSQTVRENCPLWDFLVENYNPATGAGQNLYALDQFNYAAGGAANAIISSTQGTVFTMYWAPLAVENAFWTSNAFTSARDVGNDASFRLRSFDLLSQQGGTKSGSVCLTGVSVESIDWTKMTEDGAPIVNLTNFVQANASGTGNCNVLPFWTPLGTACDVSFSGGVITLTPKAATGGIDGRNTEIMEVYPATDLSDGDVNSVLGGDTKTWADNWPVPWLDNKIVKLEVGLSSPAAADAAKPWDAVMLGFQQLSNELISESYVTSSYGTGSPQVGTAQPYIFLFNTNFMSSTASMRWMKWRVRFINNGTANFPSNTSADALNTGAVRLHSVKVSNVKF